MSSWCWWGCKNKKARFGVFFSSQKNSAFLLSLYFSIKTIALSKLFHCSPLFHQLICKQNPIQMVNFMLNYHRISSPQPFCHLFPFGSEILHFHPMIPFHFPKYPRYRQTSLFINSSPLRMFQHLWIHHHRLPDNPSCTSFFSFPFLVLPLGHRNHTQTLSHLRCCQPNSIIFIHQFQQRISKIFHFWSKLFDSVRLFSQNSLLFPRHQRIKNTKIFHIKNKEIKLKTKPLKTI